MKGAADGGVSIKGDAGGGQGRGNAARAAIRVRCAGQLPGDWRPQNHDVKERFRPKPGIDCHRSWLLRWCPHFAAGRPVPGLVL